MIKRGMHSGVEWLRVCADASCGIVFVPPLIGGDAIQQIRMLRGLSRHGWDILSFNYAGHGRSKGRFSFQAALSDCLKMLDLASAWGQQQNIPLYGLASCFATVPLLNACVLRGEPLCKLVLINAIPRWRFNVIGANFLRYWYRGNHRLSRLDRLPQAIRAYIDELLPGVVHRPQAFGVLARRRVQWLRLAHELVSHGTWMPESLQKTPVMCVYGRKDHFLQQMGFYDWQQYESMIRSISPGTRFVSLNGGHFLSRPEIRYKLLKEVTAFFQPQS